MKKMLRNIGIATIICISFLISEKTALVVKDIDNDLIELKSKEKKYYKEAKNATIKNNTIIPGLYGKRINIDKTYEKIKKVGKINEKHFIYDYIKPEISIENNFDKYILKGNPEKQSISIVFIIKNKNKINNILSILEREKIKTNFFIEDNWIKENKKIITKLIEKGNKIERLNIGPSISVNEEKYKTELNMEFCFTEDENEKLLKECQKEKKYTIKQKTISSKNPLLEIKKQISNGSIIALTVNEKTNQELDIIIKYIKSKGYKIEKLDELLSEKNN